MNTRKHKIVSFMMCIIFILVILFSLFYIVKEENHFCTGEDCPVCACLHQAEQTLKNWSTAIADFMYMSPQMILAILLPIILPICIFVETLVSQKVRLND